MSTLNEKFLQEVLALPVESRTELVEKLLESLNLQHQDEIESYWREEADRRVEEIRAGKAKLIPGDLVFEKIRNRNKR